MTATLLDIVTIALLVIIAAELVLLRHDLAVMFLRRSPGTGSAEERKEAPLPQQQTPMINFNMGSAIRETAEAEPEGPKPAQTPKRSSPPPDAVEETAPAEASTAPSRRETQQAGGQLRTPSGLVANKCPKCGSENSSYRTECYNCATQLR